MSRELPPWFWYWLRKGLEELEAEQRFWDKWLGPDWRKGVTAGVTDRQETICAGESATCAPNVDADGPHEPQARTEAL